MKSLLEELIPQEELNEEFTSQYNAEHHFYRHCLAGKNRKSHRRGVLYDFNTLEEYTEYEDKINKLVESGSSVDSLLDTDEVLQNFSKIFKGDHAVKFTPSCGLESSRGKIILGITSFADDVTTNFGSTHTVNLMILSVTYKTLTLYAIPLDYLESKFNNIIEHHCKDKRVQRFVFNFLD